MPPPAIENKNALKVYNPDSPPLDERSLYLRKLVVKALKGGGRGHIGPALSLIEIFRVLYDDILSYKPEDPRWENRDRCILSKGHGCLGLYAILADKGFFPMEELNTFCRFDSILGGHPEYGKIPGVEASTGALGHGLSIGVGMAMAAKIKNQKHRIFVVTGDGEINEGAIWEAGMSASKHKLSNLTLLVDYNKIQASGTTHEIQDLEPLKDKLQAFGFAVKEVDGHNIPELRSILKSSPFNNEKSSAIICHTVKGKGISFAENDPTWHHQANVAEDILANMEKELEPV